MKRLLILALLFLSAPLFATSLTTGDDTVVAINANSATTVTANINNEMWILTTVSDCYIDLWGGTADTNSRKLLGNSTYEFRMRDGVNQFSILGTATENVTITHKPSDNDARDLLGTKAGSGDDVTYNALYVNTIYARTSAGLALLDDSGTKGIHVEDGGQVGIGTTAPQKDLHVYNGSSNDNANVQIGGNASAGLLIGYESVSSGRTTFSHINNAGGNNNRINFGFGAITSGEPDSLGIMLDQNLKIGLGGESSPANTVDVNGNMAIGANYSGTYSAAGNGLLVEGIVGIGITNPSFTLDVAGEVRTATINLTSDVTTSSISAAADINVPIKDANGNIIYLKASYSP